jgi:hypothetical protein
MIFELSISIVGVVKSFAIAETCFMILLLKCHEVSKFS